MNYAPEQDDTFEITIEPYSGYMISQEKESTVYLYFDQDLCLPFPDLD